ncbi:DUF2236 domain-containing protein [Novosphingobium sp. G106]|uniref:oxygenase MpaB family protein n=1 Tax=Novosphingobium sp. G106 TaxID=2849500 RepID=UPI001C2CD2F7|nr:oxygenase MpaB family protein [Novosphingobium sp. G106]MBV1691040.1 DUF2236 domain-containing protein [Novosphingobium sp. G106]
MPETAAHPSGNPLQRLLVRRVQAVFNDRARGERPVVRSAQALYPPDSVIWRVHGDVTTMMIGGVTALLLQMLHPAALAGVWDHSAFRNDMLGRLRRTARFIAVTTFGERNEAEAAIERVRQVHEHVRGVLDDGTPYAASDPHLLAWVHTCEAIGFLDAWIAFGEPGMSLADQDTYFAQAGEVARVLGADPVPDTRAEATALIAAFRPELIATARTREVARMVLGQPAPSRAMAPVQAMLMQASVDVLPRWAKDMHRLFLPPLSGPIVRTAAYGLAGTLRWAFRQTRPLFTK